MTPSLRVNPLAAAALLALVNTWGDAPREESGEADKPYPDPGAIEALELNPGSSLGGANRETLIAAANRLHYLFLADSVAERAKRLNRLVRDAALTPLFAAEGSEIREEWHTDRPESRLLASATLTVLEQVRRDPDARRLGICDGSACADIYIDQSPAGRRQFCSLTCQTRHRTRAYRARRRADQG